MGLEPIEGPHYEYEEFRAACCRQQGVQIWRVAEKSAQVFHLYSASAILEFICEYSPMNFQNTELGRLPEIKDIPIDAYTFAFGRHTKGYLAFLRSMTTQTWIIKSLHASDESYFPFKELGASRGLSLGGKNEERSS